MGNYYDIITEIEEKLKKLQEINASLEKENSALRVENSALKKQLAIPEENAFSSPTVHTRNLNITIEKVFDGITTKDITNKMRAYNLIKRHRIERLSDLKNLAISDILHFRNAGPCACAVILVICEHYGIDLRVPNTAEECSSQLRAYEIRCEFLESTGMTTYQNPPMTPKQYEKKVFEVFEKAKEFRQKLNFD